MKSAELQNFVTLHFKAAQDALRCLKNHVGMLSDYDAERATYEFIRYAYPSIPSSVTQELCRNLVASTLATSRKKLYRTKRIHLPVSLNNQALDVRYVNNSWFFWSRIPVGMLDGGKRVKYHNYALEGTWPSIQLHKAASMNNVKIIRRKHGKIYAYVTCTLDVPDPVQNPSKILGFDQNFNNIYASDGQRESLAKYQHKKHEYHERRRQNPRLQKDHRWSQDFIQKLTTKIADRILDIYGRDVIVALENLKGIRKSSPSKNGKGRLFNRKLHNRFPNCQFQGYLRYKLTERGIDTVLVSPKNTSQTCSRCESVDKRNRKSQSRFVCISENCGYRVNADRNAAINIAIKLARLRCKSGIDLAGFSTDDVRSVAVGS